MVDPDSHGEGYHSGLWSGDSGLGPSGSSARVGALWREQDDARREAEQRSGTGLSFSSAPSQSNSTSSDSGGGLGVFGLVAEVGLLAYLLDVDIANFLSLFGLQLTDEILRGIVAFCVVAPIYFFIWLKFRFITLFAFSTYAFSALIYPPSIDFAALGILFLTFMFLERLLVTCLQGQKISRFVLRSALSIGAAAVVGYPGFIENIDQTIGITKSARLERAGFAVVDMTKKNIYFYGDRLRLYDRRTDSYDTQPFRSTKLQNFPQGDIVIRVLKVVDNNLYTCFNNQPAQISRLDNLSPYDENHRPAGQLIAADYSKDTCDLIIPKTHR